MRNNESTLLSPEMSDETLCRLAQQSNGSAAEDLVKKVYAVWSRPAHAPFFLAGADAEDVIQEGMLGLMKAIREFDSTKGVPFSVFARLCIQRKIYSATRSASALKHRPLNQSMSLDRPLFKTFAESHTRVTAPIGDPESLVIGNEERKSALGSSTRSCLNLRQTFLTLFLDGLSYEEMAETLGKPVKSVENAIQRIKRKSAKINPC